MLTKTHFLLMTLALFFSQEAWVSKTFIKNISVEDLISAKVILKVEKISEIQEIKIKTKSGQDSLLKILKVKILEILKSELNDQKSQNNIIAGNILNITSASLLEKSLDQNSEIEIQINKSAYDVRLENPLLDQNKIGYFFSDHFDENLSIFTGKAGWGLVDNDQEKAIGKFIKLDDFFEALRSHQLDKLKNVLSKNHQYVNEVHKIWGTPLHFAARYGNKEEIELLVKNGALLSLVNSEGHFIIHDLVKSQFIENLELIIKLMKDKKIDINIKNKQGQSALELAESISNDKKSEIINLLKKYN